MHDDAGNAHAGAGGRRRNRARRGPASRAGGGGVRDRRRAQRGPTVCGWRSEHPYDAIVLDILLPGHERLQGVRGAAGRGVWTPILMLTAKDGEFDEAEALDTGADDYVTKPFSYVALVARLRALMRRGACQRPDGAGGRRPAVGPGRAPRVAGRRRADPHRARAGTARVPPAARRRGVLEDRDHRPRLGRRASRAISTSWRCTSATCAPSSIGPFGRHGDRDDPRRGLPIGGRRWMTDFAACGSGPPSR